MKPDKRYGAFFILSVIFLGIFFISVSRSFNPRPAKPSFNNKHKSESFGKARVDPSAEKTGTPEEGRQGEGSIPVFPVDINTATSEELRMLPGIGEKTAQRIIEKRTELGGFKSIDDLEEVKWIGKVKLDRIRNLITLNKTKKDAARQAGNNQAGIDGSRN